MSIVDISIIDIFYVIMTDDIGSLPIIRQASVTKIAAYCEVGVGQ